MKRTKGTAGRYKLRYVPGNVLRRVVLIFAALYLASMGLATALVRQQFRQDHQRSLSDIADMINRSMNQQISEAEDKGEEITSEWIGSQLYMMLGIEGTTEYMDWSAGVWDGRGDKIAERDAIIMSPPDEESTVRSIWHLEEYLTEEELDQLGEYTGNNAGAGGNRWTNSWTEYHDTLILTPEGEPAAIAVEYENWRRSDAEEAENWDGAVMSNWEEDSGQQEKFFVCTDSGEAWRWENPDVDQETAAPVFGAMLLIPGGGLGESGWREWRQDEYLQGLPDHIQGGYRADGSGFTEYGSDNAEADLTYPLILNNVDISSDVRVCTMKFRMTSHAWLAAIDYMKYVYLGGAALVAACIIFVAWTLEQSCRKSAEAEAQRRDFTNAMAHEMKTPLGVIRGFAENLLENPESGKREYYLDQIIGQTEEMDGTVKEMIQVSKLDSADLVISSERIDLRELLEKEVERIACRTEERRIEVGFRCAEDAVVEGDRKLLEKAFRCLLDNAVSYNRDEGIITIEADTERCVIANTGDRIPEEDLSRVCEMLWTGSREGRTRASGEKHLGMGLYLADRIFRLLGMKMTVENTHDGVQVSVDWSGR